MNAPTLFDAPAVRTTDPGSSREAAEITRPGKRELSEAILSCIRYYGPLTAFEIARLVLTSSGNRWQPDTIRAQVSRLGLTQYPGGFTPRGHRCCLYGFDEGRRVISLALAAQVDQAEASLREMFGEFSNLRADAMTMNGCALVAVDVLAALSEAWQESVEKRLDLVTARLLAWQRIAGA